MSYIGKSPSVGNFVKLDALTASATASYTMQLNSVNFTPESVNHMLVSLNGVIQAPTTSFTISGSTLTFASTLASSDSIDFIMVYGNVLDIGTPSDSTVSTAKIIDNAVTTAKITDGNITGAKFNADVISGQTALGAEPADTDEFLVSDAGVIKRVDYSHIKGGGTHVKLLSGSASSAANHDLVGFISDTYNCYLVLLSKVTNLQGNTLDFQFADGSGPFTASNYWDAAHGFRSNSSDRFTQGGESQAQGRLGSGLDASSNRTGSYFFYIYVNPNSTAFACSVSGHNWGYRADYGDYIHSDFTLGMNNTNTVTGFRVHAAGNDATTFDYQIYGIAK